MIRLLVSVRDADEARQAVDGGAALVDLKEPDHGALGAVAPELWPEIRAAIPADIPASVALGELVEITNVASLAAQTAGFQFAKVGLSGCAKSLDWRERWLAFASALPEGVRPVAVVYADYAEVDAPRPDEILELARTTRCAALLVDTCLKDGRRLFDHAPAAVLRDLGLRARAAGLWFVLGGSLDVDSFGVATSLKPDVVAVRGAACLGGRNGSVRRGLVARLVAVLNWSN